MGQTVLSRDINLPKTFQGVTKNLFTQLYRGYLREPYCSNVIVSLPEFTENVLQIQRKPFLIKTD